MASTDPIVLTREPLDGAELARLTRAYFGDMVKFVVDVERGEVAVGGELHADAEALLIEAGGRQEDLWGGNYYPGAGPGGCIEYTSLINIRPAQGNPSMEVLDEGVKEKVQAIVFRVLGRGEALEEEER